MLQDLTKVELFRKLIIRLSITSLLKLTSLYLPSLETLLNHYPILEKKDAAHRCLQHIAALRLADYSLTALHSARQIVFCKRLHVPLQCCSLWVFSLGSLLPATFIWLIYRTLHLLPWLQGKTQICPMKYSFRSCAVL